MIERDTFTIEDEVATSKVREKFIGLWRMPVYKNVFFGKEDLSAFARMKKELRKRRAEIEEESKQLMRMLDQPFLSDKLQDSITGRIRDLKSTLIVEVLSKENGPFEFGSYAIYLHSANAQSVCSETIFIAEHISNDIYLATRVSIRERTDFSQKAFSTTYPWKPSARITGIDQDSLSHFQNCPLPPIVLANLCNRTQNRLINLLAGGCLASIIPLISGTTLNIGGPVWKELKKRWEDVPKPYRKLLRTYLTNLSSFFISYLISSKSIQRFQREPCRSYSNSTVILWKETTPKHSNSSSSCSFLSNCGEEGNKDFPCGEIN